METQQSGLMERIREWLQGHQTFMIVVAVVATLALGTLVGFIVGGGFGDDTPTAASSTTPTPSTTLAPGSTLAPGTTSPSSTTVPPVDADFVIIGASQDTYINSSELVAQGLSDSLKVENEPPEEVQRALIRFEVEGIPDGEAITQAILQLTIVEDSDSPVTIHIAEGEWSEATTWTDAPAVGAQVGVIHGGSPEGTILDIDMSAVVNRSGRYDFYLVTESGDTAEFASKESGVSGPLLLVGWGDADLMGTVAAPPTTIAPGPAPTVALTGDSVLLVGAGDIADCDGGAAATAALLDEVFADGTEGIVFTTGDNAYGSGTSEEFAECYHPTWGRFKDRTRPSPGNHDYNTDDATGYFAYFGSVAGDPRQGYYSYEAGPWHVVALNSNCSDIDGCEPGSSQYEWLLQDLAASSAKCTLAYWHHPVFSSGSHGGDDKALPLFEVLYEFGAEVVLTGHDHNYERFAPQTPYGDHDPATGIRQFVVGTGGRNLRSFEGAEPNSEARFNDSYGILLLNLYEDGYSWEFRAQQGISFTDTGSASCH